MIVEASKSLDVPSRQFKVLLFCTMLEETNPVYHHYALPALGKHAVTVCTYFKSTISPHEDVELLDGDGSFKTWLRNIQAALARRDFDVLHVHNPHYGLTLPLLKLLFDRSDARVVYTVHNSYQNIKLRNNLLSIPLFALSHRVVFCSESSSKTFPRFFRWLAGKRARVVQNGVDLDHVDSVIGHTGERAKSARREGFSIITTGRLIEKKDPLATLEAFRRSDLDAAKLSFVGDGPLRATLRAKISELGFEQKVELAGIVRREEVFKRIVHSDLFVSTSRGEGLPIGVLEAMACGSPVVLSDIPPHAEIAEGADFIPLVDPGDVAGFAEEINRYRRMSPLERAEIGRKCRALASSRFSLTKMCEDYETMFRGIIHSRA